MRIILACLLILSASYTIPAFAAGETDSPKEFSYRSEYWEIVSDEEDGYCAAEGRSTIETKVMAASFANRSELLFALANPRWKAIKQDESLDLNFQFMKDESLLGNQIITTKGVDSKSWTINMPEFPNGFKFSFDETPNESLDIKQKFSDADNVVIYHGEILVDSIRFLNFSELFRGLNDCRDYLRKRPNFDPFAD